MYPDSLQSKALTILLSSMVTGKFKCCQRADNDFEIINSIRP